MAMQIGDVSATSGMAKAIYDQLESNLEPDIAELAEEEKEPVREGWKKLAHAIATGVVEHIQANLEVRDPATDAPPLVEVSGTTAGADPTAGHTHGAGNMTVELAGFDFR